MSSSLQGEAIMVTRPAHQAAKIAALIGEAGGEAVLFPAMEIKPLEETAILAALGGLHEFSLLIFASANAVRIAMPWILKHGGLHRNAKVAAIGPATAAELIKCGLPNIITPHEGFDSEALLGELAAIGLRGIKVLIVRGCGGRELLGRALRSRGADVEYLECYRRAVPEGNLADLMSRTGHDRVKACLATSSTIVGNLFAMAGTAQHDWLCRLPFFVPHPRVAAAAFSRGVRCVFVAANGDVALMAAIVTWFTRSQAPLTG